MALYDEVITGRYWNQPGRAQWIQNQAQRQMLLDRAQIEALQQQRQAELSREIEGLRSQSDLAVQEARNRGYEASIRAQADRQETSLKSQEERQEARLKAQEERALELESNKLQARGYPRLPGQTAQEHISAASASMENLRRQDFEAYRLDQKSLQNERVENERLQEELRRLIAEDIAFKTNQRIVPAVRMAMTPEEQVELDSTYRGDIDAFLEAVRTNPKRPGRYSILESARKTALANVDPNDISPDFALGARLSALVKRGADIQRELAELPDSFRGIKDLPGAYSSRAANQAVGPARTELGIELLGPAAAAPTSGVGVGFYDRPGLTFGVPELSPSPRQPISQVVPAEIIGPVAPTMQAVQAPQSIVAPQVQSPPPLSPQDAAALIFSGGMMPATGKTAVPWTAPEVITGGVDKTLQDLMSIPTEAGRRLRQLWERGKDYRPFENLVQ